jgi:glutamate dehydrogenase
MGQDASPASLSALKALRRLFITDSTPRDLPDHTDPLWPWLDRMTAERSPRTLGTSLFGTEGSPHTWLLVVADDQPFLTDTILLAIRRCGYDVTGLWHPVVNVGRTGGHLVNVSLSRGNTSKSTSKTVEAWVLVRINLISQIEEAKLLLELGQSLKLAQAVVDDFEPMMAHLDHAITLCDGEEKAFLQWIRDGHMVLLGYRHYDYRQADKDLMVQATEASGLGVLRVEASHVKEQTAVDALGTSLGLYVESHETLVLSKTPDMSRVHRAASMDYVAVFERDAKGHVVAEHRFLGLYTSRAYTAAVREIPLIRTKLEAVIANLNWPENSHSSRSLANILETWPRDELFLTDAETLTHLARTAVMVRERAAVRILLRASKREGAVAALVYLPLDRMHTHVRQEVGQLLADELHSRVQEFKVEMGIMGGESEMARIFFRLPWNGETTPDEEALTRSITAIVRGWDDDVYDILAQKHGEATAAQWLHHWGNLGGPAYRAATPPALAAADIDVMHANPDMLAQVVEDGALLRLRLFRRESPWKLSTLMPLVDSCGLLALREETFRLGDLWLHEIICECPASGVSAKAKQALEAVFEATLMDEVERDSLNWLALSAALMPRELSVLRAWIMYLQQIDRRFDPRSVRHLVRAQPELARALWTLFEARHAPDFSDRTRSKTAKAAQTQLEEEILAMPTAEEERIWKTLLGLVLAIQRTNVWQVATPDEALAFKVASAEVPNMPEPMPWREIVVYHPTVVGVHLRGGPVARGGVRHSTRAHDFRTEILGLMQAQVRKNTIIVPTGAKGGFYIQTFASHNQGPSAPEEAGRMVQTCYKRYISALLSVTDSYGLDGVILHPRNVVRQDADDPYLVVAADKGTAKFSDLANSIAENARYWEDPATGEPWQNGFWLGDAFASGGSKGYDHKAMAITARGAWVSVMHHLGTLNIAPSPKRPLTMVGIGDMGGDVFGNGLLRDPNVKLLAAFNHAHIFVDPNPDPAISFAERQRMFNAGLGWDGYDTAKLSAGGAVFNRKMKSLTVSPQVLAALGIANTKTARDMTPEELISAILRAPVDVMWNGGIGTYVKASDEPHTAAADKANDDVRVDAASVRAKVIGEGGNLGITPKGRVELSLHGVRLNTDALDNSAGVDTSDHEVNLKILFQQAKLKGLLDEQGRVELLQSMTDEVADLVLDDNHQQNLVLSLEEQEEPFYHAELHAWQETLVRDGILDPIIDCLPTRKTLMGRDEPRYTRPELSALLAGTKTWLRHVLEADSLLLQSEAVMPLMMAYFPHRVRETLGELIPQHLLAAPLGATLLANAMTNRLGLLAMARLMRDFDAPAQDAARALAVGMHLMKAAAMAHQLESQEPHAPHNTAIAVNQRLRITACNMAAWLLRHGQPMDVTGWLNRMALPMEQAYELLPQILRERSTTQKWTEEWTGIGLEFEMAQRMSVLSPMAVAPDAILLTEHYHEHPLAEVLAIHLEIGDSLRLPALVKKARQIAMPDAWTRQAVQAMEQELFIRQRRITEDLLKQGKGLGDWRTTCGATCQRYDALVREILKERDLTVPMLSVVIGRLREMEG